MKLFKKVTLTVVAMCAFISINTSSASAFGTKLIVTPSAGDDTTFDVSEDGLTETLTFSLNTVDNPVPTDDVTVTCSIDDLLQAEVKSISPSQPITNPLILTFTTSDYATPRSIVLGAVDDALPEFNPHQTSISCTFNSIDPLWKLCAKKCPAATPYLINIVDNEMDTDGDGDADSTDPDDDGDNVTDLIEDGAPNKGDGNNDGVLDSLQHSVASQFNSVSAAYTTMVAVCGDSKITRYDVTPETTNLAQDDDRNYPLGMNNFIIDCGDPGQTAVIDFFYDKIYDTSVWQYIKYDKRVNLYNQLDSSAYSYRTESNGVSNVTVARVSIVDGGPYDMDGKSNGNIEDPSGPALAVVASAPASISTDANNTKSGQLANTGQDYIKIYLAATVIIAISFILRTKIINYQRSSDLII